MSKKVLQSICYVCCYKPLIYGDFVLYSVSATGLPPWLSGKESTCQCRRYGFDPWVGKISWTKNPLQYSCLGNSMNKGAWRSTVYGVTEESDTTSRSNDNNDCKNC